MSTKYRISTQMPLKKPTRFLDGVGSYLQSSAFEGEEFDDEAEADRRAQWIFVNTGANIVRVVPFEVADV